MGKKPFVALRQLREIEETYPMPFYTYDERGIRKNAARLKQAFSWNERCREYFTVRATPNPFLLSMLKDMGCGTDCSSMTELMISRACGFLDPDIMFSSNDTPPEEFAYTEKLGAVINLDSITHIQCLEETLGHIPETISYHFSPGGLFKISNDIMDNPGDSKYGMTTEQVEQASKILKGKDARHFDIHMFLASNTVTNEYYPMPAKILFELAVRLREEADVHVTFINLSGSIGIPYRPNQEPNDILTIGNGVRRIYGEILVPAGTEGVTLCTELGRFMMGPYDTLVTKAIHGKHTYKEYMGVDACTVDLMWPAMCGAYHHVTVMRREDEPCTRMYDVVGSLYENNDKFAINCMLPKIKKGDLLFTHDTDAHGSAVGYNYNGKLKSARLLLKEDGAVEVIRRIETPGDCFATFDFHDILRDIE